MADLTKEELDILFTYKEGKLLSNFDLNSIKRDELVTYLAKSGYNQVKMHRKHYAAYRCIWIMHHGNIPKYLEIDHINCNRQDDRIENLRLVTASENQNNRIMHHDDTLSSVMDALII